MIHKKTIIPLIAISLTVLFCAWPDFHPEKYLGLKYSWQLDMLMHSGYYFLFTLLLGFLYGKKINSFLFFGVLFTFSLLLELIQAWVPKRSVTVLDVLSNVVGIIFGIVLLGYYETIIRKAERN